MGERCQALACCGARYLPSLIALLLLFSGNFFKFLVGTLKSWRVFDVVTTFWHHDMFLTSWQTFLILWRTFRRHDVLLTSWRTFLCHDVHFNVMMCFWRHDKLFCYDVFFTLWRTFWRHDVFLIYDVVLTNFSVSWRIFDVMTNFFMSWRTF